MRLLQTDRQHTCHQWDLEPNPEVKHQAWFSAVTGSVEDLTDDHTDNIVHDCTSKVTVVTDEAFRQQWDTCSSNFIQASNTLQENLKEPTNDYMEKHHSFALYLYTNMTLQPAIQNFESAERNVKRKLPFESRSLYSSLSEAIQILKLSQVTCLSTHYRTEAVLHPNISANQIRFSTFILGSDKRKFTRNALCFEIYSCFGANITYYSAIKEDNQVLIPPYEVFKVSDIQKQTNATNACKIVYKLRSNMNCVYDSESNRLFPISVLPLEGFWLSFTLTCSIIISLLLPFVILKLYYNKRHHSNPILDDVG
ncbi:T-cell ecto-ADP-ribosyltransferase 2-like [Xenentodon cancila]